MALAPGTHLGPYEIVSLLGAGGMGEVYRAFDPRLGRPVAIKILPAEFSADPERARRFETEARAIASLNHPSICTVHDIGEHEGHRYLVMELMDGEPLNTRLESGAIPMPLLVELAIQIVDALDAAHGAAVIHRDLKPANIFLTKRNEAKILDFGLAKRMDAEPQPSNATDAGDLPTMAGSAPKTTLGMMLGTAGYMSPEQARGEAVDAQSDLFSFGLVLYEMATGQPAFGGKTMAVLFDQILNRSPKPLTELKPDLPADLSRIVEKALEKDRELRYRNAADIRADLKRLQRGSQVGAPASHETLPPPVAVAPSTISPAPQSRQQNRTGLIVAALVALAVVGGAIYFLRGTSGPARTEISLENIEVVPLTNTGLTARPAISPDGKFVAYLQADNETTSSVWLRQTDSTSNVKILPGDPQGAPVGMTIGPDATFVDVVRGNALLRVPFLGGAPKQVLDRISLPVGWSPDGSSMAYIRPVTEGRGSELVVAGKEGENQRVVATRMFPRTFLVNYPGAAAAAPAWSPDGRRIATLMRGGEDVFQMVISVFDVASGSAQDTDIPGDAPQGIGWLDNDTLVVGQALEQGMPSQLWRIAFPEGTRARLSNDTNRYADLSVSADANSLVTARPDMRMGVWVADAQGSGASITLSAGSDVLNVSPFLGAINNYAMVGWDGDQLLFTHTLNGRFEIFRMNPATRSAPEPVAAGREFGAGPDGSVVYRSVKGDAGGMWIVGRDGRNPVRLAPESVSYPVITPNGAEVLFSSPRSGIQTLWRMPAGGGTATQMLEEPVGIASFTNVSPDGKSLVLLLRGQWTICDYPACKDRRPLTLAGNRPRWTPDGRSLTYIGPDVRNLWVFPLDGSASRQLTQFSDPRFIGDFSWSADGKRIAVSRGTFSSDIILFRGLKGRR